MVPEAASPASTGSGHARSGARPAADPAGPAAQEGGGPAAHDETEGLELRPASAETVGTGPACPRGSEVRRYDIAAVAVDITLNRYLDHDPNGRMFVLESELDRVRAEEEASSRARQGGGEPGVTIGLQGDAIQPLTLRVRQGECLLVQLRNLLPAGEPASFHLHGSALRVAAGGGAAVASNPAATVSPGATVAYEWMVAGDEQEGTHYFHSHGDDRLQTGRGLFGAVVVEPDGSTWSDALTGEDSTGWAAVVRAPNQEPFREFILYYHEIGNESYQLLDRAGQFVPLVDPLLSAYRPAARSLNYRSEPFMNRMALQQSVQGKYDESAAYSSYSFGDPATPILRAYLGERVKQRVVHGGAEVFHVHHVHGGSVRWHRQPGMDEVAGPGLDKQPPLVPEQSELTDSQSIGPSETFDTENECGAGGCHQGAGDYLFHCHVAHHYFAGMWGIWRVYNTLQDGPASTDGLPPLRSLATPGTEAAPAAAVTSDRLEGLTLGDGVGGRPATPLAATEVAAWVEAQLPPRGVPKGYDAAVLDWLPPRGPPAAPGETDAARYLNQPEMDREWPGYRPRAPGSRPPILFDPRTGKLAYPLLRPHLGARPPFAPNHGPAPFLDPTADGSALPAPGANGPSSVCPTGTRPKQLAINAVSVPLPVNRGDRVLDPAGQIYVLREEQDAMRSSDELKRPLAIRTRAGQDCIDVLLRSELVDNAVNRRFSKADIHIHFVQFDVQASDGVVTGFNYEQSVRPFTVEGERLTAPVAAGADRVTLSSTGRFQPGVLVGVGMELDAGFEVRKIVEVSGNTVVFDRALESPHEAGGIVSTEFVRHRWFPDTQFGTAYFHDHVNALQSWSHGLFGALIAEPPDSTWHDPRTGAEIASGPVADVHTDKPVSADVTGSFREAVLFIQDHKTVNSVGRSSGSALNFRAEPLSGRPGDPSMRFSSTVHGDPETPLIDTFLGDPVVLRTLVSATNDVHTLHVDGHWFRTEPFSRGSPPVGTVHLGISERYDVTIPAAGGPQRMPGDYLYYNGRSFKLREGSWGILRVRGGDERAGLQPLPGREAPATPAPSVCPAGSPERRFAVDAVDVPLPMLDGKPGKAFVLAGPRPNPPEVPEPLVLHVNVGDCLRVDLTNRTAKGPVSMHPDQLAFDPSDSAGVAAGREPAQAVAPGATRTYTWFASPEVGPTTALLRDWGDVTANPGAGLYGAVVVGPPGARYTDPLTGQDVAGRSATAVDVRAEVDGEDVAYRDFTLFMQDQDAGIGTHRMPYTTTVEGPVAINYRRTPFTGERTARTDTPTLRALAGDAVRIHVVMPWSEQNQVFGIEGHQWPLEPGQKGTDLVSSIQVGALEAVTIDLDGGAGGPAGLPGDYEYGNHREPYRQAGAWGVLRVTCPPAGSPDPAAGGIRPLGVPGSSGSCGGEGGAAVATVVPVGLAGLLGAALLALAVSARARRNRERAQAPPVEAPARA